jgi:hypothetical protein
MTTTELTRLQARTYQTYRLIHAMVRGRDRFVFDASLLWLFAHEHRQIAKLWEAAWTREQRERQMALPYGGEA